MLALRTRLMFSPSNGKRWILHLGWASSKYFGTESLSTVDSPSVLWLLFWSHITPSKRVKTEDILLAVKIIKSTYYGVCQQPLLTVKAPFYIAGERGQFWRHWECRS